MTKLLMFNFMFLFLSISSCFALEMEGDRMTQWHRVSGEDLEADIKLWDQRLRPWQGNQTFSALFSAYIECHTKTVSINKVLSSFRKSKKPLDHSVIIKAKEGYCATPPVVEILHQWRAAFFPLCLIDVIKKAFPELTASWNLEPYETLPTMNRRYFDALRSFLQLHRKIQSHMVKGDEREDLNEFYILSEPSHLRCQGVVRVVRANYNVLRWEGQKSMALSLIKEYQSSQFAQNFQELLQPEYGKVGFTNRSLVKCGKFGSKYAAEVSVLSDLADLFSSIAGGKDVLATLGFRATSDQLASCLSSEMHLRSSRNPSDQEFRFFFQEVEKLQACLEKIFSMYENVIMPQYLKIQSGKPSWAKPCVCFSLSGWLALAQRHPLGQHEARAFLFNGDLPENQLFHLMSAVPANFFECVCKTWKEKKSQPLFDCPELYSHYVEAFCSNYISRGGNRLDMLEKLEQISNMSSDLHKHLVFEGSGAVSIKDQEKTLFCVKDEQWRNPEKTFCSDPLIEEILESDNKIVFIYKVNDCIDGTKSCLLVGKLLSYIEYRDDTKKMNIFLIEENDKEDQILSSILTVYGDHFQDGTTASEHSMILCCSAKAFSQSTVWSTLISAYGARAGTHLVKDAHDWIVLQAKAGQKISD